MLPNNAISLVPEPASYQVPDTVDNQSVQSFEYGGIAINDASQGRLYQVWRAYLDAAGAYCAPSVAGTPVTTLVVGTGITFVSIGFDSNMAPALAYLQAGVMKFRWFNSVSSSFQTDTHADWTSCRVSTDDKRRGNEGQSDVIVGYTRAGVCYWRQERDRYSVEYTAGPSGLRILTRLGMGVQERMQFELSLP